MGIIKCEGVEVDLSLEVANYHDSSALDGERWARVATREGLMRRGISAPKAAALADAVSDLALSVDR